MCDPRQLFFFQCGPEMPKGQTPLLEPTSLPVLTTFYAWSQPRSPLPVWSTKKPEYITPSERHFNFELKAPKKQQMEQRALCPSFLFPKAGVETPR